MSPYHAGEQVLYLHTDWRGWNPKLDLFGRWVPATVVKTTAQRVTIDAALETGGVKRVSVKPERLKRAVNLRVGQRVVIRRDAVFTAEMMGEGDPAFARTCLAQLRGIQAHEAQGVVYAIAPDDLYPVKVRFKYLAPFGFCEDMLQVV